MSIILNGTSGITNDATDLNYTGTLTGGTGVVNLGSGQVYKDASGNVGIGTSSPTAKLEVLTNVEGGSMVVHNTNVNVNANNVYGYIIKEVGTERVRLRYRRNGFGEAELWNTAGALVFGCADTERARIDSSGNLLVGTTAATPFGGVPSVGIRGAIGFTGGSTSTYYYTIQANTTDFYIGTQTLSRYAVLSGLNTFSAWSFGSDRRIKTEIEDIKYGLGSVLAMQPRQYKFKDGGDFSVGFIAQELKEVVPEAVSGEEIEFDDADTPQERAKKTMGVSKDLLIPVLVKAIQELKAIVDAQAARITALEAK